jgi:hypothetical protein
MDDKQKDQPTTQADQPDDSQPIDQVVPAAHETVFIASHHVLKDFFEIDRVGYLEDEKLAYIWEYLREKYPKAPLQEYLHQLRMIENKVGQPRIGQSRLSLVHDYLRAQKMVEDAERWRDGIINKRKAANKEE